MDYGALLDDLQAEHDDLAAAMAGISEADWDAPTPAEGWTVRDQVSHLAFFDGVATMACVDPDAFVALRDRATADLGRYVQDVLCAGHDKDGAEMLAWMAFERRDLVESLRGLDPTARVPWFGPSMAVASKATARIMETWAHGQDVVDALGLDRPATMRLRHVAHIGVRTFPNSYRARGLEVPTEPVRVELVAPDGTPWTWGDDTAPNVVRGDALDFCLVVTQRRHVDDTGLEVSGEVAREWMGIAQAFAGPPGPGRKAGQFG